MISRKILLSTSFLLATGAGFRGSAQMAQNGASSDSKTDMHHKAAVPSTSLTLAGLGGQSRTLSVADVKAMPHVTVTVVNGHSHRQETYSGVELRRLLAAVAAPAPTGDMGKAKISPRMTVVIAGATDHYRVALTLCDTDPECRTGEAIVADSMDGAPLTTDGAFKLILSEDKMPGRWVRNLNSLEEKSVDSM